MTLAFELLRRYWLPLLVAVLASLAIWAAYQHGVNVATADWQADISERERKAAQATAAALEAERKKEQDWQQRIEQVQTDATQELQKARTDADAASGAAQRLREQVGKLLATQRGTRPSASPTASSPAGPDACGMLANVLEKSVERNRKLAEIADISIARGRACEASFNAVRGKP